MSAAPQTPGQKLKAAREALGKDTSELAKRTRIKVQQLEGLEADNYDCIPAPMYVRGFIKLYAQELGLNPEPLVEQYERIRKGEEPAEPKKGPSPRPAPVADTPREEPPGAPLPSPPDSSPSKWTDYIRRLPRPSFLLDRLRLPKSEWWQNPTVRVGVAIAAVFLVLLLGFKSCGGNEEPPGRETLPEVAHPLLHEPGPVYFELPRSLE